MELCLINPNNRVPSPFSAIEPPLWAGLIAGSKSGSVAIIDAEAEDLTVQETVDRVIEVNAKENLIVVMGTNPSVSSTPKMPVTQELRKRLNARITGIHPIALKYPHTVYRPFEGCPNVPWELLPMHLYKAHNWHCLDDVDKRSPYAVIYTSLNCPFKCFFCNVHTLYGDRKVRFRPLVDIYSEITLLVEEYHVRNIKIWDELFCLDEKRVEQICDFIISNNYDLNIWAYARASTITEKMLSRMKKAGINWLAYGFESVTLDKGDTRKAIDLTRNAGVNIMGNFIFGLPFESLEDMKQTLDFAIKENFEYVNFYVGLSYPGSDWYDSLNEKSSDWSSYGQFAKNICAPKPIVDFRDRAFNLYFSRPEYLSMVNKKFGIKAENHIKDMMAWKGRYA